MTTYEGSNFVSNEKSVLTRIIAAIGRCLSTVMMTYGSWLMFTVRAQAYIDPSVMTYVIQAVAGVVIAIGAAIGIYFRRAKRKVQDKLGMDETKEQESDDIVVNK
jgi:hypothetical protein